MSESEHVDVLVVGAGISGIGAGYHLQSRCPDHSFAILEGRHDIGGTWDLFKYPGIRSDSDMYTLGYSFRPWKDEKSIADGPSILQYLRDTVEEYGLRRYMRFHHMVRSAQWSSRDSRWTVTVDRTDTGDRVEFTCNMLFMCSGYYDYEQGYLPEFPGIDRFGGRIVHPQKWTDDIDYEGKRVVVIGSGATAVTLVPELARKAEHVIMLQRSPTYIISVPARDPVARWFRSRLPERAAYAATRWKNVLLGQLLFTLSRRAPNQVKKLIKKGQRARLGPDYDIDTHLSPSYNPWDQRLCLVPDGDMFEVLKAGTASIVTDTIESFTETGLALKSGDHLDADLIVTATGLQMKFLAGMDVSVDGTAVDFSETMSYKAMMFSDVPNMVLSFGYTNASWTLKADLTCEYVCRVLQHMARHGYTRCVPRRDPSIPEEPFLDFSSGYVQRALAKLPKQGSRSPWKVHQNYVLDVMMIRHGRVDEPSLEFS